MKWETIAACSLAFFCLTCTGGKETPGLHFTRLPSARTGIDFNNQITEDDSLNMFVNEYTYMGGGVGIGDFNQDGLMDIFFAGNQVSSRLYLNKGDFKFEDITASAGLGTRQWCTGVTVVDINNDGWPDIYVSVSGRVSGEKRKNLLFINQHNLTFKEQAADYGLADSSYHTQAVFLDYDQDGRPDVYLLNHSLSDRRPNEIRDIRTDSNSQAADRLYHNEGIPPGGDHPVFKEVSRQAGIVEDGNGLGVVVSDFNGDGYPDIYVANDYIRNDLLWLNNRDGTFHNCIGSALRHQSYSSMGTDAADLNNDGLTDILTLDMQPQTNERKKMMYNFLTDQRHQMEMGMGYQPEFVHNMLQLNNGLRPGGKEPFFSEIGFMAGMAETDWSWSVLAADLDNDGWKDLHITNGLGRDPTNIDFLEYRHNSVVQSGIPEASLDQQRSLREHLKDLGEVSLKNYIFRNQGNLGFEDISEAAGIDLGSISNGAAYADLDNDGYLDLVTNNINGPAFILRNDLARSHPDTSLPNYLAVELLGPAQNRGGLGTRVWVYQQGNRQLQEQYPVRGYLSTVDSRLHFGLGGRAVDSVVVQWPGGKSQSLPHPPANKILRLDINQATGNRIPGTDSAAKYFQELTQQGKITFQHSETMFYDFGFQPLIQQKYSQEGPFISTGDINGDGREDFFVGGAFKQSGKLFAQTADGNFKATDLVTGTKIEEDMQSAFFDANGDGKADLLLVSGSSEYELNSSYYRPRLYLNEGKGNFQLDNSAFSTLVRSPSKALALADMDGDGDTDIFIGGRVSLGTYPQPPRSYLLRNDHGKFTDVTEALCPALMNPGLINAAVWMDIDNDKRPDLILAGDWMPIRIFKNNGNSFTEITQGSELESFSGFWRSLQIADINHDGYPDIIAGNLGLNNPYHISSERPAELIAKDFDGNSVVEPIFCYYIRGNDGLYKLSVGISRDEWAAQMPAIKKRFSENAAYAKASMGEILTPEMRDNALVLHCNETRSGYFLNNGKGNFSFHPFPVEAQIAPINAIALEDLNGDGLPDLIVAGNEYQAQVAAGRYDASYGLLLINQEGKGFYSLPPRESGLVLEGDVRDLKIITVGKSRWLLAAVNNGPLRSFLIGKP